MIEEVKPSVFDRDFAGQTAPYVSHKRELARHRLMCMMSAQGYNNKEIGAALGYHAVTVQDVLRQPWAIEFLKGLLSEREDDFKQEIAQKGKAAFSRIVDLSQRLNIPAAVQLASNIYLVDRFLGKNVQPVEHIDRKPEDMTDAELREALPSVLKAVTERLPTFDNHQMAGDE